jgi:phosphotransferase system HPr (HPr) family protein
VRKEVEIVNKLGLHARPAAMFVRCVIRFKSTITIGKGKESFSAASLLEVLTANLCQRKRVSPGLELTPEEWQLRRNFNEALSASAPKSEATVVQFHRRRISARWIFNFEQASHRSACEDIR